ncbi:oxidoreductase, partial [Mycobacterium sp. ITM-2017-0098]
RLLDVIGPYLPFETPINSAAMQYYTQMPTSDDTPSKTELGIALGDPAETIADTLQGLRTVGRL